MHFKGACLAAREYVRVLAQQLQHVLPTPKSLRQPQHDHGRAFVGRHGHCLVEKSGQVVMRQIVPVDFQAVHVLPREMLRQAQRKKPFEVSRQLEQLGQPAANQRRVVGPHGHVAADADASDRPELIVGADVEGSGVQQVAEQDHRQRAVRDDVAGVQTEAQQGSFVVNRHGPDMDEPVAAYQPVDAESFFRFRVGQFEGGTFIARLCLRFKGWKNEVSEHDGKRRWLGRGFAVGGFLGHGKLGSWDVGCVLKKRDGRRPGTGVMSGGLCPEPPAKWFPRSDPVAVTAAEPRLGSGGWPWPSPPPPNSARWTMVSSTRKAAP
jgi:hypothetical protein